MQHLCILCIWAIYVYFVYWPSMHTLYMVIYIHTLYLVHLRLLCLWYMYTLSVFHLWTFCICFIYVYFILDTSMNSLSIQHLCILSIYVFFICEFYPWMVEYTGDKMHTPSKGACKWGGEEIWKYLRLLSLSLGRWVEKVRTV